MDMRQKTKTLQDFVDATPNLVHRFYNDTQSPHNWNGPAAGRPAPSPAEWTNWREEQRAWRDSAVIFDQTHHMPEMFINGPDAFRLLNYVGINSFHGFVPGKAKQFVVCNPRGYMIGECVLYYNTENEFELVSGMHCQNWVHYIAVSGGYDVSITRDPTTLENPGTRIKFRYGMDGPNAEKIFQDVVEGGAPDIPFFKHARVRIAGCEVTALRHGMAGHKGVELSGAFSDGPKVRAALMETGKKYDLHAGGTTSYFSACAEGGWMAYPPPAVFTGEDMRGFREWMTADSWEVKVQLGGSYLTDSIEDYYVTPWDMGYDRIIKFDHDFIGRQALEKFVDGPRRTAVSLVWNRDDVLKVTRSLFEAETPFKFVNYPVVSYSFQQNDAVSTAAGEHVGIAAFSGYTINEREIISLALINREHAIPGTELVLTWGEPDGGSRKAHVERHSQTQVRVTVAPKPYAQNVRKLRNAALGHKP